MMRLGRVFSVVAAASLVCLALAGSVQVKVSPQRDGGGQLTGRLVAQVTVVGEPTARLVVFRLNVPDAYTINTSAANNKTWLVDVVPGDDIFTLPSNVDPAQSPVFFAEYNSDLANFHGLWGVALLTSENKDPKHVCDIIFTSGGRATSEAIAYGAGTVSVKDQALTVLTTSGTFSGVAVPLYGDLNWNGQIDGGDFGLFAAAWSAYYDQSQTLDFADIGPLANNADDLDQRTSNPDGSITGQDFGLFAWAWNKYFSGP